MRKACATILFIVLSPQVNASLITQDWQSDGNGLITLDSNTDLEWLAFNQVVGNHQEVRALLQTTYAGFRFATSDEIENLYRAYIPGLLPIDSQIGSDPVIHAALVSLNAQLGLITEWQVNTCEFAMGCEAYNSSSGMGIRRHILRSGIGPNADRYWLFFDDDNTFTQQQVLVRSVPEPVPLPLLALGLLMVAIQRKWWPGASP